MNKYQQTAIEHAECKKQMSSADWKRFAVKGAGKCPVCGKY